MIIAVDGPAASGKGTIARALAAHYHLPHLDTGLLYRAVALALKRAGGDPENPADAQAATGFDDTLLADPELREEATGALASRVSTHAGVRAALMARQRDFAHQAGGAVLDGRDIGTVIAPEAQAKLYVTASPQVRARRRCREEEARGLTGDFHRYVEEIIARDARDTGRDNAPLTRANDADLLDTSDLTIEQAVRLAIALVDARLERRAPL
jgi:CMP/dCMP kinase